MLGPPDDGEIMFTVHMEPVSLQASRAKKGVITRAVREALGRPNFLFSGEVEVAIEWLLSEEKRYHTSKSPDVDNIIKPIQDALCGPDALLINDVQVQSVRCHWVDWTSPNHEVTIWVRTLLPDDWVQKDGLVFVRVTDTLCTPFDAALPLRRERLETILGMVRGYEELLTETGSYASAKAVLPQQMLFHTAKVQGFRLLSPEEVFEDDEKRVGGV